MTASLCLLFDSDGTLVDSEILLAQVMADVLPDYGLPFTAAEYMHDFRGVRFLDIVRTLEQRHGEIGETQCLDLEEAMRSRMETRMRAELRAIEGMPAALNALSAYPRAVVSNGPDRKIRCAMESTGLASHFGERLFSAYALEVWKPDPRLFHIAAEAMGYPPERCVVVDDAAVGVAAGLEAGMHVIHLNRFPDEETTPDGAIAINHASELPAVIEQLVRQTPALA
ncbi:HAD-IA family hydrolase [Aidingimonas halophila]|uniref:Haloacid dehalogenase superfamily, subfamily IA, variant 3 with third motif having DD or ED n=1 Tax=Aidingimonas halophila TaxID=574349 RepID=A0A1H3FQT4_9GAMM|nr:HAD-IA family hydrolase [Aidingimonas halophila]GHC38346.1 sugar transferase [Aidingimonas halophila]SDX93423.1 haloacid dehalogenase superfamily, subfamily IA, variant 3 with third motif having DD or ED [Aidingimonas halophila]